MYTYILRIRGQYEVRFFFERNENDRSLCDTFEKENDVNIIIGIRRRHVIRKFGG